MRENGYPLAVMDSMEITVIRTGAATGAAAKYLARDDSTVITICGCGNQGRISLKAIATVRDLKKAYAFDTDWEQADRFAREMSEPLKLEIQPIRDLAEAVKHSDICVNLHTRKAILPEARRREPGSLYCRRGR